MYESIILIGIYFLALYSLYTLLTAKNLVQAKTTFAEYINIYLSGGVSIWLVVACWNDNWAIQISAVVFSLICLLGIVGLYFDKLVLRQSAFLASALVWGLIAFTTYYFRPTSISPPLCLLVSLMFMDAYARVGLVRHDS